MLNTEHSLITKLNQYGSPDSHLTVVVGQCENCNENIVEDQTVINFNDYLFCDQECCMEAFCESPKKYGVEKINI